MGDPTHLDFQHNTNAAQFSGRPALKPQRVQAPRVQAQRVPVQRAQIPQAQPQVSQPATPHNGNAVPACADCAGLNPFINPADSSHAQLFAQSQIPQQPSATAFRQPASTFVPQQQSFVPQQSFQPQQSSQPQQTFQPQQSFQPQQQQPIQPAFLQQPAQHPAFRQSRQQQAPAQPQGQLNLNRFESGFNFDFSS